METTESPLIKFRGLDKLLKEYLDYLYNIQGVGLFYLQNDDVVTLPEEDTLIKGFLMDNPSEIDMFLRMVKLSE